MALWSRIIWGPSRVFKVRYAWEHKECKFFTTLYVLLLMDDQWECGQRIWNIFSPRGYPAICVLFPIYVAFRFHDFGITITELNCTVLWISTYLPHLHGMFSRIFKCFWTCWRKGTWNLFCIQVIRSIEEILASSIPVVWLANSWICAPNLVEEKYACNRRVYQTQEHRASLLKFLLHELFVIAKACQLDNYGASDCTESRVQTGINGNVHLK